jgi:hypothetical protein
MVKKIVISLIMVLLLISVVHATLITSTLRCASPNANETNGCTPITNNPYTFSVIFDSYNITDNNYNTATKIYTSSYMEVTYNLNNSVIPNNIKYELATSINGNPVVMSTNNYTLVDGCKGYAISNGNIKYRYNFTGSGILQPTLHCYDGSTWQKITNIGEGEYIHNEKLYSNNAVLNQILVYDADTKQLLNKNITLQAVSDWLTYEQTSITGTFQYNLYLNNVRLSTDEVNFRAFDTNGDDYSIKSVYYDLLYSNYALEQQTAHHIYLQNTSNLAKTNLVTFHVVDQDYSPLSDAIITVKQQNPSDDTYFTLTQLTTNVNGEATTILVTENSFYRFLVEKNNKLLYGTNNPVTISINDDDIYFVVYDTTPYSDYYDGLTSVSHNLEFNRISNTSGKFSLTYESNTELEHCLDVYIRNSSGTNLINEYCVIGKTGFINSTNYDPNNYTLFIATSTHTINGINYINEQVSVILGGIKYKFTNDNGFIILFFALLMCGLGFYINPSLGFILLGILLFTIALSSLIPAFNLTIAFLIVALLIISIFTINKKNE